MENFLWVHLLPVGRVAQSVQRLTTGWTARGSNPGGARFSACPNRPWGPPGLLYNGKRVLPGSKVRPGRAADHSPPSSAAVMEEQSYKSTHPLGHNRTFNGNILHYITLHLLSRFKCHSSEANYVFSFQYLACEALPLSAYYYTGLFISPSGISELDCATTKTDTAERSISIGGESLQFFLYQGPWRTSRFHRKGQS